MTKRLWYDFITWTVVAGSLAIVFLPEFRRTAWAWGVVAVWFALLAGDTWEQWRRGYLSLPLRQLARHMPQPRPIDLLATLLGLVAFLLVQLAV